MKPKLAIIGLALAMSVSAVSRADSLDEAEAKKRGVSVEVIQLEHQKQVSQRLEEQVSKLRAQNATLKKQLAAAVKETAEAKAALAKLQSTLSPEQKSKVDSAAATDEEIQNAIKDRRVVNGMTVAQMKKAFSTSNDYVNLTGDDGSGQDYSVQSFLIRIGDDKELTLDRNIHTVYSLVRVENGKVVSWTK